MPISAVDASSCRDELVSFHTCHNFESLLYFLARWQIGVGDIQCELHPSSQGSKDPSSRGCSQGSAHDKITAYRASLGLYGSEAALKQLGMCMPFYTPIQRPYLAAARLKRSGSASVTSSPLQMPQTALWLNRIHAPCSNLPFLTYEDSVSCNPCFASEEPCKSHVGVFRCQHAVTDMRLAKVSCQEIGHIRSV